MKRDGREELEMFICNVDILVLLYIYRDILRAAKFLSSLYHNVTI